MRKKYRLPEALSGVLIVDIKNDSAAAKQNLRIADIIVRINDQEIKVIADVENALSSARKAGRDYALTRLIRDKNELFTTIPTGK